MRISSNFSSSEIRERIQNSWQEYLSKYGNLFTSDSIDGSSPPSVFVGSYGYPKVGVERPDKDIVSELIQMVRDNIGPVASFKTVLVVERLPKTRSGKILRGTMKKIADAEEYRMPATIDDPVVLLDIESALMGNR